MYIKTHDSESQGQEEAACMHVFKPTQPLQWFMQEMYKPQYDTTDCKRCVLFIKLVKYSPRKKVYLANDIKEEIQPGSLGIWSLCPTNGQYVQIPCKV